MNQRFLFISTLLFTVLLFAACEKSPGPGGTATITGKILEQDFDILGQFEAEYYVPEKRVYIAYGENAIYDDEVRTNFDGSYKFDFLRKGSYVIFAYSDCETCPSGIEPIFLEVEITEKGSTVEVEDIVVKKL